MTKEALISPTGNVVIKTSNQRIEFNADDGFGAWLTNPTKTDNELTVGESNRAALHKRLDAWMNNFKEKT